MSNNPCEACPWTQKGQPDLTECVRQAAKDGAWFCCHVHLGTCFGAERYGKAKTTERNTNELSNL